MTGRTLTALTLVAIMAGCAPAAPPSPTASPAPKESAAKPTVAEKPTAAPQKPTAPEAKPTAPVASPAASPVASPVATDTRIERAVLAKDQRNSEPIDPTTTFRPNTKEIHLVGRSGTVPSGTRIKAVWRVVDAPEHRGAAQLAEREISIDSNRPFDFSLEVRDDLAAGRYAADLLLNGQVVRTLDFSVVALVPPVLARPETELPSPPGASAPPEPKPTNLEFIVDSSGSMNDPIRGVQKMELAKQALHSLVSGLPADKPDVNVGLRAYAHRVQADDRARSCEDTELLVPLQGVDKTKLRSAIDSLSPTGWTPMAFAVQQGAREFTAGQSQNVMVLVTDGEETCAPDPVAPIKAATDPARITLHVVGFDIGEERARAQLRSMAEATGGIYVNAQTADELLAALRRIVAEQVQVIRVRSGAGQLRFEPPQSTTFYDWTVKGPDGSNAIREFARDKQAPTYSLPAAMYTVEWRAMQRGEGARFRAEIAAGQESVLRMGAIKFLVRQQPYEWTIFDQTMERQIGLSYANDMPKEPLVVPPGKYTIMIRTTQTAQPTTLVKDLEVKPNSIVEVEF
jgi:hypothetical protein